MLARIGRLDTNPGPPSGREAAGQLARSVKLRGCAEPLAGLRRRRRDIASRPCGVEDLEAPPADAVRRADASGDRSATATGHELRALGQDGLRVAVRPIARGHGVDRAVPAGCRARADGRAASGGALRRRARATGLASGARRGLRRRVIGGGGGRYRKGMIFRTFQSASCLVRRPAIHLAIAVWIVAVVVPSLAAAQHAPKPWDAIVVASFNIQVFGESKLSKPNVVEILARVVRKFDIVAIQEVRAKSDDILPRFMQAVNADGSRYHYVIGPREGRTSSKEQYAFVYDTTRIEVDPSSLGVVPDPSDRLHRPPMVARFRTRVVPVQAAFTFWLVNTHTDPDEVPQELDALAHVFQSLQQARPDEDDVIMLGDLNAGPPQFTPSSGCRGSAGRSRARPPTPAAPRPTTTSSSPGRLTVEYLNAWGVYDLQNVFGLPLDTALEVSDHNPVWAAFYPCEIRGARQPMPLAGQPPQMR